MVFSSFTFLFGFFPLTLILYFVVPKRKYKNLLLLISSLIFYAWGEPIYVFLMIVMIIINYSLAIIMEKSSNPKLVLFIIIAIDIFALGFYKYGNFIVYNINTLLHTSISYLNLTLPIGISFYTFQIISYIVDVYRNDADVQKNIIDFACYVSLFPQLIAGPIVRYKDISEQLINRTESIDKISHGLKRFIFGLGKKVIISNNIAIIASYIFGLDIASLTFSTAWLGAITYTLQIFFDFSGYSDMAIGLGEIFGFTFKENFNYPLVSKSVTDFWRRWHISLGSWFRDYVYIPLGGNRCSKPRWVFNLLLTWALTGLWHGAAWTFVLWGLYYFIFLIIEKLFLHKVLTKLPCLNVIYTLLITIIGFTLFNSNGISQFLSFIKCMFSFEPIHFSILKDLNFQYLLPYLFFGIIGATPLMKIIGLKLKAHNLYNIFASIMCLMILFISVMFLVNNSYNPFIYFRF